MAVKLACQSENKTFALIGVAGFVAERHLRAIRDNGGNLIAAMDPNDSVGILDSYFKDSAFFTEFERFDRYLDKCRRQHRGIEYFSVCTPNYLHDAHIRFGLRIGAHVICEKPLVLNPWNLDALSEFEQEYDRRVYTILQLRLHPSVQNLKERILAQDSPVRHKVRLTYITARGKWYYASWKGNEQKSGGIAANIGIHFFDMLLWVFGQPKSIKIYRQSHDRACGYLELEKADVEWFLSVNAETLPKSSPTGTFRSLKLGEEEFDFSQGFNDLHTLTYQKILNREGFGIEDARPAIELVYQIRNLPLSPLDDNAHPLAHLPQSPHPFSL